MTQPDQHRVIDVKSVHVITTLHPEEVPTHQTVSRYSDFGVLGAIAVAVMGLFLLVGFAVVLHIASQHGGL